MTGTGNCAYKMEDGTVCAKPTNQSWAWGTTIFYFCDEHLQAGAEQITGRKFKAPKPKGKSKSEDKSRDEPKK